MFIAVCTLLETRCTYLVKGESTLHRPTMIHSCIAIPSIRGRTRGELRRLGTALSPLDTKRKEIAIATKLPLGAWPLRSARASSSLHPPRGFCFAYAAPFFRGPSGYYTTGWVGGLGADRIVRWLVNFALSSTLGCSCVSIITSLNW